VLCLSENNGQCTRCTAVRTEVQGVIAPEPEPSLGSGSGGDCTLNLNLGFGLGANVVHEVHEPDHRQSTDKACC